MKLSNVQKIGTNFKKENIFLATISDAKHATEETLKSKFEGKLPKELLEVFVERDIVASEQYDVFYKDDDGYTRYVEEGPETFAGDNSDGKGVLRNIVSIWDYYSEDEVKEVMINDKFMAIATTSDDPMDKYNNEYNRA